MDRARRLTSGLRAAAARLAGKSEPAEERGPKPGARGVVAVDLTPSGVVRVGGEEWSAVAVGGSVPAGQTIEVVARRGLRLTVRPTVRPGPTPAGAAFAPLTRREWEVAQLVARGLTNRQIAEQLVLAETTVDRHVGNILAKLGFATRSQVAVWAAERAGG
jgi:DNA-binding CsgD family transcriptional regulator